MTMFECYIYLTSTACIVYILYSYLQFASAELKEVFLSAMSTQNS